MKSFLQTNILSGGLAIFSMFFGAGNLIFAVNVGKEFQSQTALALAGFIVTAVMLPIVGVISILIYEGNYKAFFERLGKMPGFLLCFFTFCIVAPLVAMPRIVTLSYTMFEPFLPWLSLPMFATLFLIITFSLTVAERRVLDILGYVISPLLILSLIAIFAMGLHNPPTIQDSHLANTQVFLKNLKDGLNTLDFLSAIFFGSVVMSILRKAKPPPDGNDNHALVKLGLLASILGLSILALIYIMLAWIGAAYGTGIENLNLAEVFRLVVFRIMGHAGSFILAIAVFLACLSTIMALGAVSAEYFQNEIFKNRIGYQLSLVFSLALTGILSVLGIETIINLSRPLIAVVHPAIITLAVANILHKSIGFKPVKSFVAFALIASIWLHTDDLRNFAQTLVNLID